MAIIKDRVCAEVDGDIIVFMIGMRINKLWKIWRWWPVFYAMPKMIIELSKNRELGMLHARATFGIRNQMVLQYWNSYEQLEAYAKSTTGVHLPAWKAFHKRVGASGDVGIWHETYIVTAGNYENVYVNMPPRGLGRVGNLVPAIEARRRAKQRIKDAASSQK